MSGNRVELSRTSAQGHPLVILRVSGEDVVGDARVYLSPEHARRVRDLLDEEILLAEQGA